MQPDMFWTLVLSGIAAVAGVGAWIVSANASRFEESWLIELVDSRGQYLLRNNTKRPAVLLEINATALYPDRPNEPPIFGIDGPANAHLSHGEAIGLHARRTRGIVVTWQRKVWWQLPDKTYTKEFTLPIRYG